MNKKFCENFKQSRIRADKRFLNINHIPARITPDRGFCNTVCTRKINDYISFIQTNLKCKY